MKKIAAAIINFFLDLITSSLQIFAPSCPMCGETLVIDNESMLLPELEPVKKCPACGWQKPLPEEEAKPP